MNKLFFTLSVATIVTAFLMLLTFSYWLLYPYKVFEVIGTVPVLQKQVQQGDYLTYEISYCKYIDQPADIHRSFVDGLIYLTTDGVADVKQGCGIQLVSIYVPRAMTPGVYQVEVVMEYRVNPIRTVVYTYMTEEFEIK